MAVLIGAIAYRKSAAEKLSEEIRSLEMIREYEHDQQTRYVTCPRCRECYVLVEGIDTTDELLQDDEAFLAKALSAAHPAHPAHMFVRDPDGVLNRIFNLRLPRLSSDINKQPAPTVHDPEMKLLTHQ